MSQTDKNTKVEVQEEATVKQKRFLKDVRLPSRLARERGDAPPLLTIEESLNPVILELRRPVNSVGQELTELEISPPTPDDILDQQERDITKEDKKRMYAKSCNVLPAVIESLHGGDFSKLMDIYWAFTE